MIYTRMNGRLGNQMFRYAFSRRLQLMSPDEEPLCFDFSSVLSEKKAERMAGWEDSLAHFHVAPYTLYQPKKSLLMDKTSLSQKAALGAVSLLDRLLVPDRDAKERLKLRLRFLPWMNREGLYLLFTGYDYPFVYTDAPVKIVDGTFECASYYENPGFKRILQREFTPLEPPLEKNRALYERISESNSVCISVRRGNYTEYKALDVCTPAYFEKGARLLKEQMGDAVFFVFSDDVAWARENLTLPGEVHYESGSDPVWEKLRLMYSCNHFVIANSTFSWWAQYLGRCPDKKVVCPDPWFKSSHIPPLIQKDFILLGASGR